MSGSEITDPDIISRGLRYYLGVRDIISDPEILSRHNISGCEIIAKNFPDVPSGLQ